MSDEHLPGYQPAPIRARLAQIALFLHVAASGAIHATQPVVLAIYGPAGYREDGGGVDPIVHGLFSLGVFLISIFGLLMTVATPIAVLAWLHRASKNAHAIASRPLEHSPGMAIGWWFVPFANLWQPLAVVREVETASDPEGNLVSSSDTSWWWGSYLLGNFLGFFSSEMLRPNEMHVVMGVLATIAHVIAALALARIIGRIRTMQKASSKRRRWADVFEDDERGDRDARAVDDPA